jgi:hypothetical protein
MGERQYQLCNYTLPNGVVLGNNMATSISLLNGTVETILETDAIDDLQAFDVSLDTSVQMDSSPSLGGFNIVGFTNHYVQNITGTTFKPFATECKLDFCVKLLKTSTSFGNQQDSVSETWQQAITNKSSNRNTTFLDLPSQFLPLNASIGNSFMIDGSFLQGLEQTQLVSETNSVTGNCNFSESIGYSCSSDYVEGIQRAQDYNVYIENVATYLTDTMRQTAPANASDERYIGTAVQQIVVWRVRWPWIIVPALLLLISIVLFILTILSQSSPTPVPWKSDPLALLYCHVDERIAEIFDSSRGDLDQALRKLKNERGVLENRENGWTIGSSSNITDTESHGQ